MYVGIGTVVLVLVIIFVIMVARRV